jgi:hypothetical protein
MLVCRDYVANGVLHVSTLFLSSILFSIQLMYYFAHILLTLGFLPFHLWNRNGLRRYIPGSTVCEQKTRVIQMKSSLGHSHVKLMLVSGDLGTVPCVQYQGLTMEAQCLRNNEY